jgi:type IV pilus assembly protein PilA
MVLKKQLKRNRKKGFTLVEVIVVLVILAVLAAISIPALTGYIDKANEKAAISQGRAAVVAAQTLASDAYAIYGASETEIKAYITKTRIIELSGDTAIDKVGDIVLAAPSYAKVTELKVKTTTLDSAKTIVYKNSKMYITGGAIGTEIPN